jgi:chromosome segregation ATPase
MNNSLFIIDTLKQSAIALERQDQQTAISTLSKITNEVDQFKKEAHALEVKSANDQQENTIQLSSIIKLKGDAHADLENTTLQLNEVKSNVVNKKIDITLLNDGINTNNQVLEEAKKKMFQNKNRIKELNDDSVGSILLSIFTLGIDRAIKAFSIEVDGVKNQIPKINRFIEVLSQHISQLKKELINDEHEVTKLLADSNEKENKIKALLFTEFKLHKQEDEIRKRVVFF